jgi:L-carnitine CoA-transferase
MAKRTDIPKFGLLSGLKVVNAATATAGPFCAQVMAEMGADIVWIEKPHNLDNLRNKGGLAAENERRNIRSICLNIAKPEGRQVLLDLVKDADIFLEASKGGQYERMGITDEVLWEVNPKLVIAHLSGYGQKGVPEYVTSGSYDATAQAFGCLTALTGYEDRDPVPNYLLQADYYTAFMALYGLLAGVLRARETGIGDSIDVAQYESAFRQQGSKLMNYLNRGVTPHLEGTRHNYKVGVGAYLCKDDALVYIDLGTKLALQNALPVLGLSYGGEECPEGTEWVSLDTSAGKKLERVLINFCASKTAHEVEWEFVKAGVPCSEVLDYAKAEKHPHYIARGTIVEWDAVDGRRLRGPAMIPFMKNFPSKLWRGCPTVGMDNVDVLEEIGRTAEEIAKLQEDRIVIVR